MRLGILVVGIVLLTLLWTNPDRSDFEKWVYKQELVNFQKSSPLDPVAFRSANYLLFSIHELLIVREQNEFITDYRTYAGVGILGMMFPTSSPRIDAKQSPFFKAGS